MKNDRFVIFGVVSAAIGVSLGAFGAHGLRTSVPANLLAIFETGVRYQMYHAFGLILTGILLRSPVARPVMATSAGWAFVLGTILFSGSLYALSLTGVSQFGAVAPFGGLAFIGGWVMLGLSVLARRARDPKNEDNG